MPVSTVFVMKIKIKCLGRVYHTHEGKTWLSKYSESLIGISLDVITVDGFLCCGQKQKD